MPTTPVYAASKAAVTSLTEVLHYQFLMDRAALQAHVLFPGPHLVNTNILSAMRNRPAELRDVAPIVQRKCATCHVAGGVAPFALGTAVMTTLWRRPFVCGTGGALGIVVVHFAALWLGRGSRELLRPSFLLAAAAPLPKEPT